MEQGTNNVVSTKNEDDLNEGNVEGQISNTAEKLPLFSFILMSSYAFLVMFQPYSSFLVPFFVENVGITVQQVFVTSTTNMINLIKAYSEVFPIWTYAYFISLFLFGILSECLGYKVSFIPIQF